MSTPPAAQPQPATAGTRPALVVIAAGVCAALHVGKLAPAIPALRAALDMTLVQAAFALSLVQLAGLTLGLLFGGVADALGGRRSMVVGLLLLALASALGGAAPDAASLMAMRGLEGLGFLMVALPAPGLVRRLVAPAKLSLMMGVWGSYMPLATALVLLLGPLVLVSLGWRIWWWLLAGLTLLMAALLLRAVPAAPAERASPATPGLARIRLTLAAPGPWLVAVCFALYSGQWLAVIGFLPAIVSQAGVPAVALGAMTALAAAVNMLGNLAAGRLQQRGVPPRRLLLTGFAVMGAAALAAFHGDAGAGLPPLARYAAVLLFSGVGGLIPATLFTLAVRVAPSEGTLASTVGWVQQWSSLGQMLGPPAVAWVASRAGSWQYTGWVTATCSLAGLALVPGLMRQLRPLPR